MIDLYKYEWCGEMARLPMWLLREKGVDYSRPFKWDRQVMEPIKEIDGSLECKIFEVKEG